MDRYLLAAGVAAIALAFANPAAAKVVHHGGKSAAVAARCTVPARADAVAAPLAGDRALEDKIEQLTGVISALSDRLASLEEKLGPSDDRDDQDADDDTGDDDVSLASARGAGQPGLPHRPVHGARAARPRSASQPVAPAA